MRGLKLCFLAGRHTNRMSHLLQMRGLKPKYNEATCWCNVVASFTDAWIETIFSMRLSRMTMVASFTDAWIETWVKSTLIPSPSVASFTDAWIETEQQWRAFDAYQRRIFYRCVDWNNSKKSASVIRIGRIFYRCVDWNRNMFYNI